LILFELTWLRICLYTRGLLEHPTDPKHNSCIVKGSLMADSSDFKQ